MVVWYGFSAVNDSERGVDWFDAPTFSPPPHHHTATTRNHHLYINPLTPPTHPND